MCCLRKSVIAVLTISILLTIFSHVQGQCTIPYTWRSGIHWWTHYTKDKPDSLNDVSLVEFNETSLIRMTLRGQSDCEKSIAVKRFHLMSFRRLYASPVERFCAEGYPVSNTVMLYRETPGYANENSPISMQECSSKLGARDKLQVLISYTFAGDRGRLQGQCPFAAGDYKLEYQNAAEATMCVDQPRTRSSATVTTGSLTLRSCYNKPWSYSTPWKEELTCVQRLSGSDGILDQTDSHDYLVLSYWPLGQVLPIFYCARYGVDPNLDNKMVLDLYAESKSSVSCVANVKTSSNVLNQYNKRLILRSSECEQLPCTNGGTCVQGFNSYRCQCAAGYNGRHCENADNTACGSMPCRNGATCESRPPGYICTCGSEWKGDVCEIKRACSSAPCQHGGTCTEVTNGFICMCTSDWSGSTCQTTVNGVCSPNPCLNQGKCEPGPEWKNGYQCKCGNSWKGSRCEIRTQCSLYQPCNNGGICDEEPYGWACRCTGAFTGDTCKLARNGNRELFATACTLTCINGGACVVDSNGQSCHCPDSQLYTGRNCSVLNPWFIVGLVLFIFLVLLFFILLGLLIWWCYKTRSRDPPTRKTTIVAAPSGGPTAIDFKINPMSPSHRFEVLPGN